MAAQYIQEEASVEEEASIRTVFGSITIIVFGCIVLCE